MLSNNLFADYLLSDNRKPVFSMLDDENLDAFLDFFSEPTMIWDGNEQGSVALIDAPIYRRDPKTFHMERIGLGRIPVGNSSEFFSPKDLILYDFGLDGFYYPEHGWCLPHTIDLLQDMRIVIQTEDYIFDEELRANRDGFTKQSFRWEKPKKNLELISGV